MEMVITLIYWVAGYWATGRTIYANKVVFYTGNALFLRRAVWGLVFGWVLIPWAIIKMVVSK